MKLYTLDPLCDERWLNFTEQHASASVFHTRPWLEALKRSYGYEPIVFTTSAPTEKLSDGIVFCRVESWLTGRRLVSLPFADHCQPLVDAPETLRSLLSALRSRMAASWRYVELRPLWDAAWAIGEGTGFSKSASYQYHALDLRPDSESLYRGLHVNCIQRKIRRAEREQLSYEEGRSESQVDKFYSLFLLTRRRHGLLSQPREWFRNLTLCFGNRLKVRVVSKDQRPVAAMVTIEHRNTIVYKYGASDPQFHKLGGMPFLFWKTICDAKNSGANQLDLGRSDDESSGLVQFKQRLGAASSSLSYYRFCSQDNAVEACSRQTVIRNAFARLPNRLYRAAGSMLYRHVG